MIFGVGLKARLLATLLALIVMLQLGTSYFVLERTRHEAEAHARNELESGGRVFSRLLRDRERRLLSNLEILVSDFGLRRAVATGDRPTVESVLENHGARIDADIAFLVGLDGDLRAVAPARNALDVDQEGLRRVLERAKKRERSTGIAFVDGKPQQIVLTAVRAPQVVGWIGMGFALDEDLAGDLRSLTGLEVSFWSVVSQDALPRITSTLERRQQSLLVASINEGTLAERSASGETFHLPGSDWISWSMLIDGEASDLVGATLQTSWVQAMAPYFAQRDELLRFFAVGLAMALAAALWIAGNWTRPIAALADAARSISSGNLATEVALVESRDEIGDLSRTFRVMQAAVAEREERIVYESMHDRLTRLPNRQALEQPLKERLAREEAFVAAIFDVVRLKDVNGTLGASIGDAMLRRTADRLVAAENVDFVGRLGGDEFFVLLPLADRDEIERAIRSLMSILEAPHEVQGVAVALAFSVGFACVPDDADELDRLMRRVEMALARGKKSSDRIASYEVGLEEENQRRVGILIELERALERNDLELHYQPKIEMETGRAVGVEALIRWTHERLGRMNPEEFIGIAEQTGFIGRISNWVLATAVDQIAYWRERGVDLVVSINLSAHDAADDELPERIRAELRRVDAPADRLNIEITESAIMARPEKAAEMLQRVRDLGVAVSIDDFGTGHSSLAQLKTLPSDEIKIDQAFVRNLRENTPDEAIIKTSIELGHSLGLKVVAEGVEDRISWNILARHGCDVGQGYWMGRPMSADDLLIWLDRFEKEGLDG